jgi:excisionase family DNA binding protein
MRKASDRDNAPIEELLRPSQAARLLSVHVSAVYRWIHAGTLPAYRRAGSRYLIRRSDALAVLVPMERTDGKPRVVLGAKEAGERVKAMLGLK